MRLLTTLVCLALFSVGSAFAQVPRFISYQGVFDDALGIDDGPHTLRLTLYDAESGGRVFHRETKTVEVVGGLFSTEIGPLPEELSFDRPYWLGVAVDEFGDFEPLTRLTTSPYAFTAVTSQTALRAASAGRSDTASIALGVSGNATGVVRTLNGILGDVVLRGAGGADVIIDGNVITIRSDTGVGGGQTTDAWRLRGNTGTDPRTDFLGTLDNRAFEIHVDHNGGEQALTDGRGRVLRFEPTGGSPNIIGGFRDNRVAGGFGGGTISGGGAFGAINQIQENFGTIGGGSTNDVSGSYGTIGGGLSNNAGGQASTVAGGQENSAGSLASTVGGGAKNRAGDWNATIAGGRENQANSRGSSIGGGEKNELTGIGGTIAGGVSQRVFGNYGTIGGGDGNATSNTFSTIGGGRYNNASATGATVAGGVSDTASGSYAAIGGGIGNTASNVYTTVAGGLNNTASGQSATVAGGTLNVASGDYSMVAGGYGMTVTGNRSFGFLAGDPTTDRKMTLADSDVTLFGNTDLYIGGNDGAARRLVIYEAHTGNGTFPALNTHYSAFQVGEQNQTIDYILPTEPGRVGQMLTISAVNGRTFTLSWTTPPGETSSIESTDDATRSRDTATLLREIEQKMAELEQLKKELEARLEADAPDLAR